ncbi:membrane protein [Gordonia Phage Odesza]|uniref:Membrane protein n=3 Tax=Tanisvirus tanis TaxID=2844677 RepID=A0A7D5JI39_9CAUD|nr:membrane protein [Gordonia phage Tanis]QFP95649.1 membrane protein [Gordonia phage Tanis]QGJ89703.1 membrane protein [Gordonia Phage Odesza]QKY78764.1 membrane protein [Gordonia phage Gill]QLF83811.1 membrane protein [Gordonia phage Magel]
MRAFIREIKSDKLYMLLIINVCLSIVLAILLVIAFLTL